jgi:hypothetical protein
MASDASFPQKKETRVPMPIFKYFAVVGSACLYSCLFPTPTSATAICDSTGRCMKAPSTHLDWTKSRLRRSFALRAMSRLRTASRRCLHSSFPTKICAGNVTPPLRQSFGSRREALRKDCAWCGMRKTRHFASERQVREGNIGHSNSEWTTLRPLSRQPQCPPYPDELTSSGQPVTSVRANRQHRAAAGTVIPSGARQRGNYRR